MNILEEIIAYKKIEIEKARARLPKDKLLELIKEKELQKRDFSSVIKSKVEKKEIALIAEVKKASPSKGIIKEDFNPQKIAASFQKGGAACLSVLTDEKFFQGNLKFIHEIKGVVKLPVLRKDFIVNPYQIYESVYNEADCILLIVATLEKDDLKRLFELSCEINLDMLIEIHDEREMEIALDIVETHCYASLLGINNRNLETFETNLNTTKGLVSKYKRDLKDKIVVSESGIYTNEDIKSLMSIGIYSFLVGEALMKEKDLQKATMNLLGYTT